MGTWLGLFDNINTFSTNHFPSLSYLLISLIRHLVVIYELITEAAIVKRLASPPYSTLHRIGMTRSTFL